MRQHYPELNLKEIEGLPDPVAIICETRLWLLDCQWTGMEVYSVGAHGYGNFGDDYYVDVLQQRMPDLKWTIGGGPLEYRPFAYDFTIVAGGGLLYTKATEPGAGSLKYHFGYPGAAQCFGKKTAMLGLGVQGPLAVRG